MEDIYDLAFGLDDSDSSTTPTSTYSQSNPYSMDKFNKGEFDTSNPYGKMFSDLKDQGLWGDQFGSPVGYGDVHIGGGQTPEVNYLTQNQQSAPSTSRANTSATTGGRPEVQSYASLISKASQAYDVPEQYIKGLMDIESQGVATARSPKGAMGLMQVMPFHFKEGEDGMDPETNIMRGAKILKDNYNRYGNWNSAAAAYFGAVDANGQPTTASDGITNGVDYVKQFQTRSSQYAPQQNAVPDTSSTGNDVQATSQAVTSGNVPSIHGLTQAQKDAYAGDPDVWALCGPVAAMAFAARNGRQPTPQEAKELAVSVGWTSANGMAGPASEVSLLKKMGVAAHLTQGVDWESVKKDVMNGNPVIIDSPGHYFVVEGYDPSTGKFDFGNSAKVWNAAGNNSWFKPDELPGLSQKYDLTPRAAIFMDNPGTPAPSVVAGASPKPGTTTPIQNPDGSQTTERSITVTDSRLNDGKPTNIPSVWDGKVVSNEQAVANAAGSGRQWPAFSTIDDAVSAAKQRSKDLGNGATSVGGAQLAQPAIRANIGNRPLTLWDIAMGHYEVSAPIARPPAMGTVPPPAAATTATNAPPAWLQRHQQEDAKARQQQQQQPQQNPQKPLQDEWDATSAYERDLTTWQEQAQEVARQNAQKTAEYNAQNPEALTGGMQDTFTPTPELIPIPPPPPAPNTPLLDAAIAKRNQQMQASYENQQAYGEQSEAPTPLNTEAERVKKLYQSFQDQNANVPKQTTQAYLDSIEPALALARSPIMGPFTSDMGAAPAPQQGEDDGGPTTASANVGGQAVVFTTPEEIDGVPSPTPEIMQQATQAADQKMPGYPHGTPAWRHAYEQAVQDAGYLSPGTKADIKNQLTQRQSTVTAERAAEENPNAFAPQSGLEAATNIVNALTPSGTARIVANGPESIVSVERTGKGLAAALGAGLVDVGKQVGAIAMGAGATDIGQRLYDASAQASANSGLNSKNTNVVEQTVRGLAPMIPLTIAAFMTGGAAEFLALPEQSVAAIATGNSIANSLLFAVQGAGSSYERIIRNGGTPQDATAGMVIAGALNAALASHGAGEVIAGPMNYIADNMLPQLTRALAPALETKAGQALVAAGNKVSPELVRNFLVEAGKMGAINVANVTTEGAFSHEDPMAVAQHVLETTPEALLQGGILGSAFHLASGRPGTESHNVEARPPIVGPERPESLLTPLDNTNKHTINEDNLNTGTIKNFDADVLNKLPHQVDDISDITDPMERRTVMVRNLLEAERITGGLNPDQRADIFKEFDPTDSFTLEERTDLAEQANSIFRNNAAPSEPHDIYQPGQVNPNARAVEGETTNANADEHILPGFEDLFSEGPQLPQDRNVTEAKPSSGTGIPESRNPNMGRSETSVMPGAERLAGPEDRTSSQTLPFDAEPSVPRPTSAELRTNNPERPTLRRGGTSEQKAKPYEFPIELGDEHTVVQPPHMGEATHTVPLPEGQLPMFGERDLGPQARAHQALDALERQGFDVEQARKAIENAPQSEQPHYVPNPTFDRLSRAEAPSPYERAHRALDAMQSEGFDVSHARAKLEKADAKARAEGLSNSNNPNISPGGTQHTLGADFSAALSPRKPLPVRTEGPNKQPVLQTEKPQVRARKANEELARRSSEETQALSETENGPHEDVGREGPAVLAGEPPTRVSAPTMPETEAEAIRAKQRADAGRKPRPSAAQKAQPEPRVISSLPEVRETMKGLGDKASKAFEKSLAAHGDNPTNEQVLKAVHDTVWNDKPSEAKFLKESSADVADAYKAAHTAPKMGVPFEAKPGKTERVGKNGEEQSLSARSGSRAPERGNEGQRPKGTTIDRTSVPGTKGPAIREIVRPGAEPESKQTSAKSRRSAEPDRVTPESLTSGELKDLLVDEKISRKKWDSLSDADKQGIVDKYDWGAPDYEGLKNVTSVGGAKAEPKAPAPKESAPKTSTPKATKSKGSNIPDFVRKQFGNLKGVEKAEAQGRTGYKENPDEYIFVRSGRKSIKIGVPDSVHPRVAREIAALPDIGKVVDKLTSIHDDLTRIAEDLGVTMEGDGSKMAGLTLDPEVFGYNMRNFDGKDQIHVNPFTMMGLARIATSNPDIQAQHLAGQMVGTVAHEIAHSSEAARTETERTGDPHNPAHEFVTELIKDDADAHYTESIAARDMGEIWNTLTQGAKLLASSDKYFAADASYGEKSPTLRELRQQSGLTRAQDVPDLQAQMAAPGGPRQRIQAPQGFDVRKFSRDARKELTATADDIVKNNRQMTPDQVHAAVARELYGDSSAANIKKVEGNVKPHLSSLEMQAVVENISTIKKQGEVNAKRLLNKPQLTADDLRDFAKQGIQFQAMYQQLNAKKMNIKSGSQMYTSTKQRANETAANFTKRMLDYVNASPDKGKAFLQASADAYTLGTSKGTAEAWGKLLNPKTTVGDWGMGLFYAGILGPGTFGKALVGNTAQIVFRLPRDLLMTAVHHPGALGAVTRAELSGLMHGMIHGISAAYDIVIHGSTDHVNGLENSIPLNRLTNNRLGKFSKFANLGGTAIEGWDRLFVGADAFSRAVGFAMEKGRQAGLEAERQGDTSWKNVKHIYDNPEQFMIEHGNRAASETAFQNQMGTIGNFLAKAQNINAVGRWMIPFVRTTFNSMEMGMERTPVGFALAAMDIAMGENTSGKGAWTSEGVASKVRSANKDFNVRPVEERFWNAMVGSAIGIGIYSGIKAGTIQLTGAAPNNQKERLLWEQQGKIPYGIKLPGDDRMRSYRWMGDAAVGLSMLAEGMQGDKDIHKGVDPYEAIRNATLRFAKGYTQMSVLSNTADILKAATEGEPLGNQTMNTGAEKLGESLGEAFIPVGATGYAIGTSQDPYVRYPTAKAGGKRVVEDIASRMPMWMPGDMPQRSQLKPALDVWGAPVANKNFIDKPEHAALFLFPFGGVNPTTDPVTQELVRLHDKTDSTDGLPDRAPSTFQGHTFSDPDEKYEWQKKVGQNSYYIVNRLMQTDIYNKAPDQGKASKEALLQAAYTEAKEIAFTSMDIKDEKADPNREAKYNGLKTQASQIGENWWDLEKEADRAITKSNAKFDAQKNHRDFIPLTPKEQQLANRYRGNINPKYTQENKEDRETIKKALGSPNDIPFVAIP